MPFESDAQKRQEDSQQSMLADSSAGSPQERSTKAMGSDYEDLPSPNLEAHQQQASTEHGVPTVITPSSPQTEEANAKRSDHARKIPPKLETQEHEKGSKYGVPTTIPARALEKKNADNIAHDHTEKEHGEGGVLSIRGMLLMFTVLFLPMLAIPFILLGLVAWDKVEFPTNTIPGLPIDGPVPTDSYYTLVSAGKFDLVGSWASTLVGNISALFIILFSFLIARSLVRKYADDQGRLQVNNDEYMESEGHIRELLGARTYMKLWEWAKSFLPGDKKRSLSDQAGFVAVAGIGIALFFTALIIVGDNWLHAVTETETYRYYDQITFPVYNASSIDGDDPNSGYFAYAGGYMADPGQCGTFLNSSDTSNTLPCSLTAAPLSNINNPFLAYLVLEEGISKTSSNFGNTNFSEELHNEDALTASADEVVTFLDSSTNQNHSFLFFLDGASQNSSGKLHNWGFDYIAPTVSLQTTCAVADHACQLTNGSSLYNCSSIFSGNLSSTSTNGAFKIPDWNTTFYQMKNGVSEEIGLSSDQNPFLFNVTAQVQGDIIEAGHELPPSIINTTNGNLAFALSCTGTVYNLNYSLINGSIEEIHTGLAPPRLASIVRAPLQAGFGRYNLYQAAILSVLDETADYDTEAFNSTMARSFSQIGIALSSGPFTYTTNIAQRVRWDYEVTRIPHAPVWFLATACALFGLVSLIIFVVALLLRRIENIRTAQRRLKLQNVNELLKQMADDAVGEGSDTVEELRSDEK